MSIYISSYSLIHVSFFILFNYYYFYLLLLHLDPTQLSLFLFEISSLFPAFLPSCIYKYTHIYSVTMERFSGSRHMSISDTYLLASKARSKLQHEASRHDHDLRILVSHANMLDNLMDSLAKHRNNHQVEPISVNNSTSLYSDASSFSFDLSNSSVHHYESQYEADEEDDDDEEEEEEEEEYDDGYYDEEEYEVFEGYELTSTKIYQTNKNEYSILPTVKESPLDEDLYDDGYSTTQSIISTTTTCDHKNSNPVITSVAVIEVSEDEDEDDDSIVLSPSSEVPSLCYSESDSEKEDDNPRMEHETCKHKKPVGIPSCV